MKEFEKERIKQRFLALTSFKNVSGNYQFKGDITPERVYKIALELLDHNLLTKEIDVVSERNDDLYNLLIASNIEMPGLIREPPKE